MLFYCLQDLFVANVSKFHKRPAFESFYSSHGVVFTTTSKKGSPRQISSQISRTMRE